MTFSSPATEKRRLAQSGKPFVPHKYQKRAIRFLLEHANAMLLLDPGLGKTSSVYAAFSFLLKRGLASGMLVFAPLRPVYSVWPKERDKWQDFNHLDAVILHGPQKAKLGRENHDVYVINYEGLDWLIKSGTLAFLLKKGFIDTIVWDEVSKMKNSSSGRYKKMKHWIHKFKRRWGLTGTPAGNGLLNLFGECFMCDCGKAFGPYVSHFRAQFFVPGGEYDWAPAPGAEKLIYERLKPLAIYMDADELLEMPKEMPHRVPYTLPAAMRKHYDQLEDEFLTIIEDQTIRAVNKGVASGKLRQFCSGAMYTQEYIELTGAPRTRGKNREFVELHTGKLDAFEELIEGLEGKQTFIAYEFQHDLARIQARFGEVPYIGGGVSPKLAQHYELEWNKGNLPWLFGHPASIAHGMNLQESSAYNIVFFTVPWDFELYDQWIRRLRRQGNLAKFMNVYHMVGENTIEEDVMLRLIKKFRTQRQLFQGLQNRRALKVDYDTELNVIKNQMIAAAQAARKSANRVKVATR